MTPFDAAAARMGLFEKTAAALYEAVIKLADSDEWLDIFEEVKILTEPDSFPNEATDDAVDAFYDDVDRFKKRVLARVGLALRNSYLGNDDRIVKLAQEKS